MIFPWAAKQWGATKTGIDELYCDDIETGNSEVLPDVSRRTINLNINFSTRRLVHEEEEIFHFTWCTKREGLTRMGGVMMAATEGHEN